MTKSTTLFIHTTKKHPTFRALLHGDAGDDVPGSWVAFHQLSTHTLLKRFPWPQVLQYRDKKLKQMYLMDILERTEDVQLVEWFYRTYCPDEEITPYLAELMFIRGMLNPFIRNLHAEGKLPVDQLHAANIIQGMAKARNSLLDGPRAVESCCFLLDEMRVPLPLRDLFALSSIIVVPPVFDTSRCKHIINYLIAERRQIFPWSKFEFICKAGALAAVTFMLREYKHVRENAFTSNHYNVMVKIESEEEALQYVELCHFLDNNAGQFPPIHVSSASSQNASLATALQYIHVPGMREIVEKMIYNCMTNQNAPIMFERIIRHGDLELLELMIACHESRVDDVFPLKQALAMASANRDIVRAAWSCIHRQGWSLADSTCYPTLEPYCHKTLSRDMVWDVYDLTMQHGAWNKTVFQMIYDKYKIDPSISAVLYSGKLDAVQWMYESGFVKAEDAACVFISTRDVEITKYTYAKAKAATGNKIEVIVWDERQERAPSNLVAPRAWKTMDIQTMTRAISCSIHACQESLDARKSFEFIFSIPECRQLVQDTIYRMVENLTPDSSAHWGFHHLFVLTFMNSYKAFRAIFDNHFELWPTSQQWIYTVQDMNGSDIPPEWTGHVPHLDAILNFYWDGSREMKDCITYMFTCYCRVGVHLDMIRYLLGRFGDFLSLTTIRADVADNVWDAFMT